ncbi:MAG TPA: type I glutamate--ammonia ligase [Caldilineae bacterium]|nr:type I glutamate--ammonia ligase [Caldilineae bacterium]
MQHDPGEVERVREVIERTHVEFINLQFTDIVGSVKQVTIPVSEWDVAVQHGIWFDGSSIEGFARIAESDMYLKPDLSTFAVIPWESEGLVTARCICDVYTPKGEPFIGDPRYVLKRVLAEAEEMGFVYQTGPELEFFLFRPGPDGRPTTTPHDSAGYFDVSTDMAHRVRRQMVKALNEFGIAVEAAHHEVATGQHEIDIRYGPALTTADNTVTLRVTLKAIAQRNGLYCTFMPKPVAGINGSGMHTHQSLAYKDSGKNAFADPNGEYGLSTVALQFIAGQLAHARGMSAVVAPLVNSYKRLVPGYEAPVYISWARINRSALIRIPRTSPGRPESTRIELRCPDPAANPYLAFAVMLAAGLDGIRKGMEPPPPAEENLYEIGGARGRLQTLPGSLGEALVELEKDEVIQAALGHHIFERYLEAKRIEWDEYRSSVSEWELERYLPTY